MIFTPNPVSPQQSYEDNKATSFSMQKAPNGNLYYVVPAEVGTAEATGNVWIMRSADNGATWAKIYDGPKRLASMAVFRSGTTIFILGADFVDLATVHCYRFDTGTETFLADLPDVGNTQPAGNRYALTGTAWADGTITVVYWDNDVGEPVVKHWNGASWSAGVQIPQPAGYNLSPEIMLTEADADRAHLWGVANLGIAPLTSYIFHISVTKPDVLGTYQHVADPDPHYSQRLLPGYCLGLPAEFGGEILVPYRLPAEFPGGKSTVHVLRGAAAVDPVWTDQLVADLSGLSLWCSTFSLAHWFDCALLTLGTSLYCFFTVDNGANPSGPGNQSWTYFSVNTGAGWAVPDIAYANTDLPGEMLSPYPVALGPSSGGVMVATVNVSKFFAPANKYDSLRNVFLTFGGAGPSLTASCADPPAGMVGDAYSHNLTAVGGTPPYTFTVIAGALPPNLTLDPATGAITGVPTAAGTFVFTVRVADSGREAVDIDCSIVIRILTPCV